MITKKIMDWDIQTVKDKMRSLQMWAEWNELDGDILSDVLLEVNELQEILMEKLEKL